MKQWYEYNIKERYEKIYKQFTLKDFWDWWSDGKDLYMEIRVKNFDMMKQYADAFHVPYSASGLFINKSWQLERIVKHFRKKSIIWFGVNPKRKVIGRNGYMTFSGKDVSISHIKYLFIDIDRVLKDGIATNEDLMNADFLSNKVLEELDKAGFAKNYCKICSANGVQLLIKLDVPIEIPMIDYDSKHDVHIETTLFNEVKSIIHRGIGKILPTFSNKFRDDYNVEIDERCFNMGRIGALPYSFNFRYETPVIRGIIELKNEGNNEGFSDYLRNIFLSKEIKNTVNKNFKQQTSIILSKEYKMKKNELDKNVIVDLMMTHTFPDGGINNTLWYGIKLLLHSNGIDNKDPSYLSMHLELKAIHDRDFSDNGLESIYKNNYNGPFKQEDLNIVPLMINKYLRLHKIKKVKTGQVGYHKPIFPISPRGKKKESVTIDIVPKILKAKPTEVYTISKLKEDPLKDLSTFSLVIFNIRRGKDIPETFKKNMYEFTDIGKVIVKRKITDLFCSFIHAFKTKWDSEITIYMMKYYMNDYLNHRRW